MELESAAREGGAGFARIGLGESALDSNLDGLAWGETGEAELGESNLDVLLYAAVGLGETGAGEAGLGEPNLGEAAAPSLEGDALCVALGVGDLGGLETGFAAGPLAASGEDGACA